MSWWNPLSWRGSPASPSAPSAPSYPNNRGGLVSYGKNKGLLQKLRDTGNLWFGPGLSHNTAAGFDVTSEKLASGPRNINFPWFPPYYDDGVTETREQRLAYRNMLADPVVSAPFKSQIYGVAAQTLQINPADKRNARDKEIAEFIHWNLTARVSGGFAGMAWNILSGGLIDGFSVNEKVIAYQQTGRWTGKDVLAGLKMKDVNNDLVLVVDPFRNLVNVKGLRYNGGLDFSPADFVIYRHMQLYERPVGLSAFRCVYSRWWVLKSAWELRTAAMRKRALPFSIAHYGDASTQPSLNDALAVAAYENWMSAPESARVEALDTAGKADDIFHQAIQDLREEITLGLTGAILQQQPGQSGVQRGNSETHADSANLWKWFLSSQICALLNDHDTGLIRDLVDLNYVVSEYPQATISAVDANDMKQELDIDTGLHALIDLSKEEIRERYSRAAPRDNDPSDVLAAAAAPAAQPGAPGGGGSPFAGLLGTDGPDKGPPGNGKPPDDTPPAAKPAPEPKPKPPADDFAEPHGGEFKQGGGRIEGKGDEPSSGHAAFKSHWDKLLTGIDSGEVHAGNYQQKVEALLKDVPAAVLKAALDSIGIAERPTSKAHAIRLAVRVLSHQVEAKNRASLHSDDFAAFSEEWTAYIRGGVFAEPAHKPAGSPEGGQFTSSGGGGAKSATPVDKSQATRNNVGSDATPKQEKPMENQKAIDDAKDAMSITKEDTPGYLHHFTRRDQLAAIAMNGLTPQGNVNPSISATKVATPTIAETLFEDAGTEDLVLLRFKEKGEWRDDPEFFNNIFVKSDEAISPENIEVKTVFGWKPLAVKKS